MLELVLAVHSYHVIVYIGLFEKSIRVGRDLLLMNSSAVEGLS